MEPVNTLPHPCHLTGLPALGERVPPWEFIRQRLGPHKILHALMKRIRLLINLLERKHRRFPPPAGAAGFTSGELVRVRPYREIEKTLDPRGFLKGCGFMDGMKPFCGTRQRIFKPVERFLDERDYRVKKCKGIYILEGVLCEGTKAFGRCDRACHFFWREEWLEGIPTVKAEEASSERPLMNGRSEVVTVSS